MWDVMGSKEERKEEAVSEQFCMLEFLFMYQRTNVVTVINSLSLVFIVFICTFYTS